PAESYPLSLHDALPLSMEAGSVIVDVAIDQGGNFATSEQVATHDNPIFMKHDVLHYTVSNIPGAVPKTATEGLTNATLHYVLEMAKKGANQAIKDNQALQKGVNVFGGHLTNQGVAEALEIEGTSITKLL